MRDAPPKKEGEGVPDTPSQRPGGGVPPTLNLGGRGDQDPPCQFLDVARRATGDDPYVMITQIQDLVASLL